VDALVDVHLFNPLSLDALLRRWGGNKVWSSCDHTS
jgi:hypothetical protein